MARYAGKPRAADRHMTTAYEPGCACACAIARTTAKSSRRRVVGPPPRAFAWRGHPHGAILEAGEQRRENDGWQRHPSPRRKRVSREMLCAARDARRPSESGHVGRELVREPAHSHFVVVRRDREIDATRRAGILEEKAHDTLGVRLRRADVERAHVLARHR